MIRKYLLVGVSLLTLTCKIKTTQEQRVISIAGTSFTNPLLASGPDPWVLQKDTTYYYMNTYGNRIAITTTNKMSQLKTGAVTTVWTPPATGMYSKEIWAPEMHWLQNKWFIYFAADDGVNDNHRIYAIECDDADPVKGTWTFKGKIADTLSDMWAIDATVFKYNDQLYMMWSGWPGNLNVEQDLYIAKMKDPLTLDGERVKISEPTADWEKIGGVPAVNEGPEALINEEGDLFVTYSASGCWTDGYSLGLLSLKEGGDPMNANDWIKSNGPVFSGVTENGAYAPGHNSFFKSRDGKENWILYHANSKSGEGCGDRRNPRMQKFTWNANGIPDFGEPVKINQEIHKPGGE